MTAMPRVPILMAVTPVNVILVTKVAVLFVMISTNVLLESITVIPMHNVPTVMVVLPVPVTTAILVTVLAVVILTSAVLAVTIVIATLLVLIMTDPSPVHVTMVSLELEHRPVFRFI